jgi:hypothetical protein
MRKKQQPSALPPRRITKAHIEAKLREATGELDEEAKHGRRIGPWVLGVASVIVVTYRLGVRLGSRRSTMLEIRRLAPPAAR